MAAKKKQAEAPAPKIRKPRAKKAAPVDPNAPTPSMSLTETECLRIRTYLAEYRRHNAEATLRLMEKQDLLRQLDPDNKLALLDQAIRGASESAARAQAQHTATLVEVEKRLGVSIKDFSFDEDTGQLWPHPAEPTKKE